MERFKVRKKKAQSDHSVSKILKDYCENCSGHGFQYWVADSSVLEKLFWVAVVLFFFTSGAAMVNEAVTHWSDNPDAVEITSFSKKATDLIHPAITICNPNGYDVGEYLRAVFDNFEYSNIDASETLRSHFPGFSDVNSKLMTEALDGGRFDPGGIMKFPHSSNIEAWRNAEQCKDNRGDLVPYYFDPNSNLMNESLIRTLLGEIMIGIDNSEKWKDVMGLKVKRIDFPFKGQGLLLGWHPPKRYEELFEKANDTFWKDLSSCYQHHLRTAKATRKEPNSITDDNFGCAPFHRAVMKHRINSTIMSFLSEYDVFVLEQLMAGNSESFDAEVLTKAARNYGYLYQFCQNGSVCEANQIDEDLSNLVSKIHFLMNGALLPEHDFGKMIAKNNFLATGDEINFREWDISRNGMMIILDALFGKTSYKKAPPTNYEKFGHPLWWLELFNHQPSMRDDILRDLSEDFPYKFNTIGLSKLLMYGNYIGSRGAEKTNAIQEEIDLYPYTKKDKFKEPYFAPVDLDHTNIDFNPSITEAGVCQVYNGDSMHSLFKKTPRMNDLENVIDVRNTEIIPQRINGTGKISQKTFWLDASNKYMASLNSFRKYKGSLLVAINDWQTYYSVRLNQIELKAGTEVIIKVNPVVHSTSADFKSLTLEERECRYPDEQQDPESMFKTYRQKGCHFECRLRYAAHLANCIPWDYPIPKGFEGIPICLSALNGTNSLKEFHDKMDDPGSLKNCRYDCLPDCEEVKYNIQVDRHDLDVDFLCQPPDFNHDGEIRVLNDWKATSSPLWSYLVKMLQNQDNVRDYILPKYRCGGHNGALNMFKFGLPAMPVHSNEADSLCKSRYAEEVVKLTVQIAEPTVMMIQKDVSATFTDHLGTIGGTIGLFTGLSLISVVEASYWLLKVIILFLRKV